MILTSEKNLISCLQLKFENYRSYKQLDYIILLYLKRGDPKFTVHLNPHFHTTVANWCFIIHPRQIKLM